MGTCIDSRGVRPKKGGNYGGGRKVKFGGRTPRNVVRLAERRSEQLTNHHLFARPHYRKSKGAVKFDPAIQCESAINTQMIASLRQSKNDSLPFPKFPLNARRGPWGIERALYSGSVRLHVCDHGDFKQIRNERE